MTNQTPGVRNVMQCDGLRAESCHNHGAGHELLAIQARVIAATPSKWRDGIVQQVTHDGWIAVTLLESASNTTQVSSAQDINTAQVDATEATVWLWNHADRVDVLPVGTPVAVHSIYHALAIGREHVNVLVATPLD